MNWFGAERKKFEEELRKASTYTRSLIEASVDPLVTISPTGKITDVNEATIKVTGVQRDQLIGTDFSNYFTEPELARAGYLQVFEKGYVTDYPLTIWHSSGKVTHVLYNASVYRDEAGEIQGVFAAARDVTEQRQASQYARSLLEASLDPLVTISPDGKITDVNQATVKITGVERDQLIGTDFSNYFTEPEMARTGYLQVFEKGFVTDYPLTIRHISGKVTHVLYNASVYRDVAGNIQGVFAAARDITERKRMEEELRGASLYTRSLIEASLDPLVTISPEGKITDVNKATELVTGSTRERLIGSDFSDYFTEPEKAREGYQKVISHGFVRDYPLTIRHASGRLTDVLYNAAVYMTESGKLQGVFAAARDITERKQAEANLRELNMQVQEAANVLATSVSEILSLTTELAAVSSETAESVNETTATVEEVKQTAQLSSEKSLSVSERAQQAVLVAQKGNNAVSRTVEGINHIRGLMESVAESIVKLSEQTQAIGEIITAVSDLAQQSNLLAVNAAIEASKAGEQGKGFAVVAQEIKSLASQSKQATEQVRAILGDIQKATSASVMAAEQVSKAVDGGVKQASESGESIKKLAESITESAQAATQIAASSQQQFVGMDQVALAMENIKQASQQNVMGTKQAEQAAQNLNELGQKLKEMVAKYTM
jgi:PAS domain S-box-containing protein